LDAHINVRHVIVLNAIYSARSLEENINAEHSKILEMGI
jgi:hypothetical protein